MLTKSRFWVIFTIMALASTAAMAVPTIEFADRTGSWVYTPKAEGRGVLSFTPTIVVTRGEETRSDTLRGALVNIPSMRVTQLNSTEFKLAPINGGTFTITDAAGKTTYLTGTLGTGNAVPSGRTAEAYTVYQGDLTNVQVNNSINSEALKRISDLGQNARLDFDLSLNATQGGFKAMVDGAFTGTADISGSCSVIPAPGAMVLGAIGLSVVGWLRRRRTL